ncbi:hypothetical protein KKG52_02275 [Patescibacteria group bacterium]|nr:hypothetical protein [Patescibacteria group bacterium]
MNQDLSKLDPKLKEAYDRVMGGSVTINPRSPVPEPTTPQNSTATSPAPPAPQAPIMAQTAPTPPTLGSSQAIVHSVAHKVNSPEKKRGGGISPVLILLGILVFLIIYSVVWIKVFNLSVSLINP